MQSLIGRTDRDLSAQTTNALFKLKKGQVSDVVNTGYALEILKNLDTEGNKIKAAHILFQFKDISEYINDLKDKKGTKTYISFQATTNQQ